MPWEIRRENNQYCVYKEGTSEREGCHETRAMAARQMAALYASEPNVDKAQSDAPNYRFVGTDEPERCQTCEYAEGMRCTLFDFTFQAGYTCDAWKADDDDDVMEDDDDDERGYVEDEIKAEDVPDDVKYPALWRSARDKARRKYNVYPSAYANGYLVQEYERMVKERYGDGESGYTSGKNYSVGVDTLLDLIEDDDVLKAAYKDLGQWFAEEWVDISRPKDGGGFEPCGRPTDGMSQSDYRERYPKCLPRSRAERLSDDERQRLIRRKRRSGLPEDGKPQNTSSDVKASYTYNGVTVTATRRRPSTRDDKKYMRTVTVDGKDYLVHYGDPNLDMQRDNPERRANFLARHNCSAKRDPKSPGFWACLDWQRTDEKTADDDSNALKAISRTDEELRVGNYMVLFGGRDLEGTLSPRLNKNGTRGEYFTKSTVFESPYTAVDLVAVDWEHGHGELEKDEILGRVDWKTARVDERGLFVERVLNRRNRYVKYLEELIEAGLIGNSSEAVSDSVEKADDGQIVRWPIRRDTLTVTPMEPRMITQNVITAIKALSECYPALKSLLPAEIESDAETEQPETDSASVATVADESTQRRIEIELTLLTL